MKYVIDAEGAFVCDELGDVVDGKLWTADQPPQPSWAPHYVGFTVIEANQCIGGHWEDPERPDEMPVLSPEQEAERYWRDAELARADKCVWTLEDLAQDSSAWRAYRVQLREWPQSELFPNPDHRPEAPQ